jgi:syntaxin-binding protein 1
LIDDLKVQESLVFSLDRQSSVYSMFNPSSTVALTKEISLISKQLSFVLGTIGEYPHIRYYNPTNKSNASNNYSTNSMSLSGNLAMELEKQLKELKRQSPEAFGNSSSSDRSTLLIVDRSVDVVAPLLHEFTYQALMADVVKFEEDGKVKWDGEGSVDGAVIIDEQNDAWFDTRHKHIAEVMDYVADGVKQFASQNKAAQFAKDGYLCIVIYN